MNNLYVTVVDGKAIINGSEVNGCLTTVASIAKVIKPMSNKELSEFYESLTHKKVKRFASKGDAAIRIHKFISPTSSGKKSGPKILPSRKVKNKTTTKVKTKGTSVGKTKRIDIRTKTISLLDHDEKIFQNGSIRKVCYEFIVKSVKGGKLSVTKYLVGTKKLGILESTALDCLKKLSRTNQKVQATEVLS